jgi:DNA helicase-2/ATP-dependent DNA helicase PcrA
MSSPYERWWPARGLPTDLWAIEIHTFAVKRKPLDQRRVLDSLMPMKDAATALLADLNPAQRTAAEAVRGPLCILAGAGTGKTRTITYRIAYQVACGLAQPNQILAVTFTERAAAELRARLGGLGIGAPIRAATFHAAAWAQLRWFWSRVEPGPLPEVLTSKVGLLVRTARRLGCEARDLASEIEWAKARRLDPAAYAKCAQSRQLPVDPDVIAEIYERYEADKTAAGAIDYEDMLLRMGALLEHPEIAAEVRERYRFFTVDEFQDVNPAQWALLQGWLGDSEELCVVGDDDQTIFSFTGASSSYLTNFRQHFPHAEVVTLTQSYRSTPPILNLANRILWTKPAAQRKRLTASCDIQGPPPVFREFNHADDEVRAVVARVGALIDEGTPPREIAVCYRINAQSEPFEEALRAASIPYVLRGDGGFFERPEVRQALRALADAATRMAPDDPSLVQRRRVDRDVEHVLRERLSWHPRREPTGDVARERWRNVGELLAIASTMVDESPAITLPELVAQLRQRAAATHETAGEKGAVTLLTLHRAKGTEFDAMFLVALEEGFLPIAHAKSDQEVEEERRLLYVGVTRARRDLWLSWARSRPGWGGRPQARRPSRFLYNLGQGAPTSAAKPARPVKEPRRSGPPDSTLLEELRAWRLEQSLRDSVPAYVIFPDSTLRELATQRPETIPQLQAVSGFGPKRIAQYGEDVLRIVKSRTAGGDTAGRDAP